MKLPLQNTTMKWMLVLWSLLVGAMGAMAQQPFDGVVPTEIQKDAVIPSDCTDGFAVTNLVIPLEAEIAALLPGAPIVDLVRFTEQNYQGQGNGPFNGDTITYVQGPPEEYVFATPDCCFQTDTVGYLITADYGTVVSNLFGIIRYTGVYAPPVANNDAYNVDEDATLTVDAPGILENDEINSCCPETLISVVTDVTNGTLQVNNDGSFTYTPSSEYCGGDSFEYEVVACNLTSRVARVDISVDAVNDYAPIAVDDNYSTPQNTTLVVPVTGVLTNDYDNDGDCPTAVLTAVLVTDVANGTLLLNPDGSFSYTPDTAFCGADSFTYLANDGLDSEPATVTIEVFGQNQCPYRNDEPNLTLPVVLASEWDTLTADTSVQTLTFSKVELLARVTDDDIGSPFACGITALDWSLSTLITEQPLSDIVITIDDEDNMTVEWTWAGLLGNFLEDEVFTCQPCSEYVVPAIWYYVSQENCDDVGPITIDLVFETDDSPTVAPFIDVTGTGCIAEDTVDYQIDVSTILYQAALSNVNNCCTNFTTEIVGCCPVMVCQDDAFIEKQIVNFWPQDDFTVEINGEEVSFIGTQTEVTTANGGTATLDGSVIRYTPPANWPLCNMEYDYIPYVLTQTETYECGTTADISSTGILQVAVCQACDAPVAVADEVVTCEDQTVSIALQDLVANDYDLDFSPSNIVAFSGTTDIGFALLGTEAPPAMVGGFDLTPFDQAVQDEIANGTDTTVIPSGSCISGDLLTSVLVNKRTIDNGWDTWSHGYTGVVWVVSATNEVELTLPDNTTAFSFYIEPESFGEYAIFAVANDGTTSDVINVEGNAGAQGIAFYGQSPGQILVKIVIVADPGANGFALAEFAISQQPIAYICNVGVAQGPENGELIIDGYVTEVGAIATSLQYQPDPDFFGTDTFSYQYCIIDDCGTNYATGSVTVNVQPVSDLAPVAGDDELAAVEDTPLTFPLSAALANDTDGGDMALNPANVAMESLCFVTWDIESAEGGSVTYNEATGEVTYTPAPNFNGVDSFTYTIGDQCDSECNVSNVVAATDTATVTITVAPVNDAPIANVDAYTVNEDGSISGNVFDNDSDIEKTIGTCSTWTAVLADESVENGTLVFNTDGSFTYTPDADYFGTDAFAYYFIDCGDNGDEALASETVFAVIQIIDVNDAPIADPKSASVTEDNSVSITLSGSDKDGTIVSSAYTQPANGTVSGTWPNVLYTPNANYFGNDSFTYTVTDDDGAVSAPATVSIVVVGVNDRPMATPVSISTPKATEVSITLSGSDVDGDGLIFDIRTQPLKGTLKNIAYPDLVYVPNVGFSGTDRFTYLVNDGSINSYVATVTVQVVSQTYVMGDWNADGRADLGTYETKGNFPGNWYGKPSSGALSLNWGYTGAIPVPGDYDGDGTLDVAVYDPNRAIWYIRLPSGNKSMQFGFVGCVPVQSDYDGDGVTDIAVYYKETGTWFVMGSTEGFRLRQFGWSAAKPVPADYDGDGRTDLAVFDSATANWYFLSSTAGFAGPVQFGYAGVIPVPADYDGDGKADGAVFDPVTANWFFLQSTAGFAGPVQFGFAGVVPVPADYDADGKADGAVYDQASGNWYLLKSTEGFATENFGGPDLIPVTSLPGLWSIIK